MMKKLTIILLFIGATLATSAQKVDSIFFNLYTDSLKKGFYNYINVDGKLSDGTWRPMDSTFIQLSSNAGKFRGNDLFIDSAYAGETVTVKAVLRSNPTIHKVVTIYIRKRGFTEPLKNEHELFDEMKSKRKKSLVLSN